MLKKLFWVSLILIVFTVQLSANEDFYALKNVKIDSPSNIVYVDGRIYENGISGLKLKSGVHEVVLPCAGGDFKIPINVGNETNQIFTLFCPEKLNIGLELALQGNKLREITFSSISFRSVDGAYIEEQATLLSSESIDGDLCKFKIVDGIPNTNVKTYMISIKDDMRHYRKYLYLDSGVSEFLKKYSTLKYIYDEEKGASILGDEWECTTPGSTDTGEPTQTVLRRGYYPSAKAVMVKMNIDNFSYRKN